MTRRAQLLGVALLSLAGVSMAQIPLASATLGPRPFAQPWGVTFQHIQDAMRGKFGTYAVEQIRLLHCGLDTAGQHHHQCPGADPSGDSA